jgi:hypothetical protein
MRWRKGIIVAFVGVLRRPAIHLVAPKCIIVPSHTASYIALRLVTLRRY